MTGRAWRDLLLITLAGLVLRLFFAPWPGHVVDVNTFGQWALNAAAAPWDEGYERTDMNYPPAALLVFELIGRGYTALVHDDPDHTLLRIAIKLPTIAFDLLGGFVLYGIARRFVPHPAALIAIAGFDLNPAIIYDSALWGQNDTITSVSALAAVWALLAGRRPLAWVILAFAVLNKPPVIVLAPLFAIEAFVSTTRATRPRALRDTAIGIVAAIVFGYLIALPFYTDRSFIGVYERMISWYQVGSSLYPYNSANAFNLYALFGDFFQDDNVRFALVPQKIWADLAFVALAATIYWRYTRLRDGRALLEACFLVMLAFFIVLTEMHERYLIYALTFVPALAAIERVYRWIAGVLTFTQWMNLEYSLTYMWIESDKPAGIDPKEFAPALARVCALANIGALGVALQHYLPHADARAASGEVPG